MLNAFSCMDIASGMDPASTAVVVSGLPRSGTSMAMRLLAFGGLEPLTDGIRVADERNPFGYFEYEPVKRPECYREWIGTAAGRSVKLVSRLIRHLPSVMNYRIIVMQRDMQAVLRSQLDMAQSLSGIASNDPERLGDVYALHLEETIDWIDSRPNMRMLKLSYEAVLADPDAEISRICQFLPTWRLNAARMRGAIDPARVKAAKG